MMKIQTVDAPTLTPLQNGDVIDTVQCYKYWLTQQIVRKLMLNNLLKLKY